MSLKLSCEGCGSEAAATEVSAGDEGDLVGDPARGVETVHLTGAAAAATADTGAALHTSQPALHCSLQGEEVPAAIAVPAGQRRVRRNSDSGNYAELGPGQQEAAVYENVRFFQGGRAEFPAEVEGAGRGGGGGGGGDCSSAGQYEYISAVSGADRLVAVARTHNHNTKLN